MEWTLDQYLNFLIITFEYFEKNKKINWHEISKKLNGRSANSLRNKWNLLDKNYLNNISIDNNYLNEFDKIILNDYLISYHDI